MLETIYVVRHGYRSNWAVDPSTGTYSSAVRTPTGIPSDPALASYGVLQAEQLGTHLLNIDPQPDRLYSSPYYRCLQTILPYVTKRAERDGSVGVWVEKGLGEFYGTARFQHPSPADLDELSRHFDHLKAEESPVIVPSRNGETIEGLHDRMAYCLAHLIARTDADPAGPKTILLCSHAAAIIAIGRVLTGNMPEDVSEEDFSCYTCGVSTFTRRSGAEVTAGATELEKYGVWDSSKASEVPYVEWKGGRGVGGGWECEKNSDCSFLENGEERGWNFWMEAQKVEEEKMMKAAEEANGELACLFFVLLATVIVLLLC